MIFGAVWDRDMVSALEHAGAVELSMRSWRFISGRRRCAVDRLEGPRSRRHEVVASSCFGTAIGTMKRGSGRLGGAEGPHCASVRLWAPLRLRAAQLCERAGRSVWLRRWASVARGCLLSP